MYSVHLTSIFLPLCLTYTWLHWHWIWYIPWTFTSWPSLVDLSILFFFSVGAAAHCGLWPVERYLSICPCLSPTLSIFSLPRLEDLFPLLLSILSWVFLFISSLPVLEWMKPQHQYSLYPKKKNRTVAEVYQGQIRLACPGRVLDYSWIRQSICLTEQKVCSVWCERTQDTHTAG